ncbi:hypothetical protein COLO4_38317 [Corchorus olitorius]|uniref:Uncharacterized protein n=1 Tax=Corchorus olitorius TaxID=93759 RepID=A0A1R3FVK6_9ROSI|nr:hypothetical protein COLO4_38317 [Corchorus olitorius]
MRFLSFVGGVEVVYIRQRKACLEPTGICEISSDPLR